MHHICVYNKIVTDNLKKMEIKEILIFIGLWISI